MGGGAGCICNASVSGCPARARRRAGTQQLAPAHGREVRRSYDRSVPWTEKPFTRNAAMCSACGAQVEKGAQGWANAEAPKGHRVRCLDCGPPEVPAAHVDPVGGSSALRLDARHRGDNYLKGAQGEYLMGTYLAAELAPGTRVLTDRKVPGVSPANVDHIVVATSGVWVIDSKKWAGEIQYRSPRMPSTDPRRYLHIDGIDRTDVIAKIYRLVIPIAQIIGDPTVPRFPVMAFIEPTWGLRESVHFRRGKGPYEHDGVLLSGGHGIIRKINEPGPLSQKRVEELHAKLDAAMPPR